MADMKNRTPFYGAVPTSTAEIKKVIIQSHSYSEDETVIGTWIDGRPIYRKLFNISTTNITANTWTNLVDLTGYNADNLVNYTIYRGPDYHQIYTPLSAQISADKFMSWDNTAETGMRAVVLEYTKGGA